MVSYSMLQHELAKRYRQELQEKKRLAEAAEPEQSLDDALAIMLTPLHEKVAQVLKRIPIEKQRDGLSLPAIQELVRGRYARRCHAGELAAALRKLGFERSRRWISQRSHCPAIWRLKDKR